MSSLCRDHNIPNGDADHVLQGEDGFKDIALLAECFALSGGDAVSGAGHVNDRAVSQIDQERKRAIILAPVNGVAYLERQRRRYYGIQCDVDAVEGEGIGFS